MTKNREKMDKKKQSIVCAGFCKFSHIWSHWVLISFYFITTSEAAPIVNHKQSLNYKVVQWSTKGIALFSYEKLFVMLPWGAVTSQGRNHDLLG